MTKTNDTCDRTEEWCVGFLCCISCPPVDSKRRNVDVCFSTDTKLMGQAETRDIKQEFTSADSGCVVCVPVWVKRRCVVPGNDAMPIDLRRGLVCVAHPVFQFAVSLQVEQCVYGPNQSLRGSSLVLYGMLRVSWGRECLVPSGLQIEPSQ